MGIIHLYSQPTDPNAWLDMWVAALATAYQGKGSIRHITVTDSDKSHNQATDKGINLTFDKIKGSDAFTELMDEIRIVPDVASISINFHLSSRNSVIRGTFPTGSRPTPYMQVDLETDLNGIGKHTYWKDLVVLARESKFIIPSENLALEDLTEKQREKVSTYDALIKQMGASLTAFAGEVQKQISETWDAHARREAQLQADFAAKQQQLDALKVAQEKVHADRRSAMDKEEQELAKTKDMLDRRARLKEIIEKLKEPDAFKSSDSTSTRRGIAHLAFILSIVAFLVAAGFASVPIWKAEVKHWSQITLFGTCSVAAVGLVVYYIKFLTAWASDHAEVEFQNWRALLDFSRAHWVSEFIIENNALVASEQSVGIPDKILEKFTNGLFQSAPVSTKVAKHPMEDAALSVRKLKVGPVEVETIAGSQSE